MEESEEYEKAKWTHEQLRAFGRVARAWAYFEGSLVLVLEKMLTVDHFRARLIWASSPNFRARQKLLNQILFTFCDDPQGKFNNIMKRASNLSKKRNLFMHALGYHKNNKMYFIHDSEDDAYGFNFENIEEYQLSNVDGIADAIMILAKEVFVWSPSLVIHTSPKMHRAAPPGH
ncbi:MAG TPA: hypothetical protein VN702_17510 [Acetobacteraceae bacterium]|nr:hypothetical protein [Acetobacteraceae bacterium]